MYHSRSDVLICGSVLRGDKWSAHCRVIYLWSESSIKLITRDAPQNICRHLSLNAVFAKLGDRCSTAKPYIDSLGKFGFIGCGSAPLGTPFSFAAWPFTFCSISCSCLVLRISCMGSCSRRWCVSSSVGSRSFIPWSRFFSIAVRPIGTSPTALWKVNVRQNSGLHTFRKRGRYLTAKRISKVERIFKIIW